MKIITGRAKSGKSTYIYNQINDEIAKNKSYNLILLVPDLMTYQTEYDFIERLGLEGIVDFEVLTFKRLAYKILDELGENQESINIDNLGKMMILKQIFEENRNDLKLFGNAFSHPGFLKKCCLILQELKQNLVSAEDLKNAINKTDNMILKQKLSEILIIYSAYHEKMGDKLFDEEDIYQLVISNISKSELVKNSKIWIDGFESFNKQRIDMIQKLEKYSEEISLSLNIDDKYLDDLDYFDDWEAFKTIHDTFTSIDSILEDIEIISLDSNKAGSDEIKCIEKNLFVLDIETYNKSAENIHIYSSMDKYSEIEITAAKIVSLVRDEGYRWKDIKIALGDLDSYIVDIEKLFHKFKIPYFADTKRDITNNPISKYILSLLDILIWNFKYDDVFQYLKTGLSPLDSHEINHLENYALEYGIEGKKWFNRIEKSDIEEIREKFISDFKDNIDRFSEVSNIGEITAFIFQFLKTHDVYQKTSRRIEELKLQNKYEQSSEHAQVWNSIIEVFNQILAIGEDNAITPLEYRKILETGFTEVQISLIPPTIDRVEIGDIERIAVESSKALFIIGANEGNLDSEKYRGLLLDNEIEALYDYDINIMNCSNYYYFKKKHMIYKLFSSPIEKLYISYSLGTVDGKSLSPSLYIDIMKMIFPNIKEQTERSNRNKHEYITNIDASYDVLVEKIRKHLKGSEIDEAWKAAYSWYANNQNELFNMIVDGFNYKNQMLKIDKKYMDEMFQDEIYMSVSRLENYAECQFKYFIKNVLRANPRLTQNVEFYDIGNIYHSVLEDFIDSIIYSDKKTADLTEEDTELLIENSIEKIFAEYSTKISALNANNRNSYLKKKMARVLRRTGDVLVKQLQRGVFTPKYTELKIGIKDKNTEKHNYIPPLEIQTENKLIKIRGIIDRIDTFEDENGDIYLNIIDYKSSKKDIDFTDTYEGIQMQLLVYLKAVLENGEKLFGAKPKVAGVYYYSVDDPIIKDKEVDIESEIFKSLKLKGFVLKDKDFILNVDRSIGSSSDIIPAGIKKDGEFSKASSVFTEDEFKAILEHVDRKIVELSENMLDGKFYIEPYRKKDGNNPCKYCDYISICQFDKFLGNEYRQIKEIKKDIFLEKIAERMADGR